MSFQDIDSSLMEGNPTAQLVYRLGTVEAQLAEKNAQLEEKNAQLEEKKRECQELKDQNNVLIDQLCKAQNEVHKAHEEVYKSNEEARRSNMEVYKSIIETQKSSEEAYKSSQEVRKSSDEIKKTYDELHKSMEDRRMLQARNALLQNEVLLMQGDVRFMLRNVGKKPPPREGQVEETQSTPTAKKLTSAASLASTPQGTQAVVLYDPDVTPTPAKAIPVGINQSSASASKDSMSMVPYTGSSNKDPFTTVAPTPKLSRKKSVTFSQMVGDTTSTQKSGNAHGTAFGSTPALRERASFNCGVRSDDPFTSPLSHQSSAMSLNSQQSSTDLHVGGASRAMASTNWRQPPQQQTRPSPDVASLQDVRQQFQGLLTTVERWADIYTGTMHTSVRSKEEHTAWLVRALGDLVEGFDAEKLWNDFGTRTLLVASYINRRVLVRLFGDQVLQEIVGGEEALRLRELAVLERSTPARDLAQHREMVQDKAELIRAALSGAVFRGWRGEEVRRMAGELFGRLTPIVPISERVGGLREMEVLVGEAIRVAFAMRCLPRAWHLAFDEAGARVSLSSMAVRRLGERRGRREDAAAAAAAASASLEEELAVVLGITPHLVSKLWTPGGVVPEELLKAEVLAHPAGRGFSLHH